MDDPHQEISEKLDKELNRYIGQYASLFILNEEIEIMLNSDELKPPIVETKLMISWLNRMRELVQDGLKQSGGS